MKLKITITLKQVREFIFSLIVLVLVARVSYWAGENKSDLQKRILSRQTAPVVTSVDKSKIDLSLFWQVWDRLSATYLDRTALVTEKMVFGAIKGMVSSLGDPYTAFLPPKENKAIQEDLGGAFEGVGIQLGFKNGSLAVIAPLPGTPAEKAGVKAGDLILKIDDKETFDISINEAMNLIRGAKGTKVKLTFFRENNGGESFEKTIARETIVVPSVALEFPKENIARIKLMRFGEKTNDEWNKAISEILAHSPKVDGVILDVRNDPGGFLSGSIYVASEFLPSGVVVQQQSSDGSKEQYMVDRTGKLRDIPLVVLINKGSASASEIVAGALQDRKRAKIIGEVSFGKGTIQEAHEFDGGSGLHVTTARWLTPLGKSINKAGITPDIKIADDPKTEDVDEQLQEAIKTLGY